MRVSRAETTYEIAPGDEPEPPPPREEARAGEMRKAVKRRVYVAECGSGSGASGAMPIPPWCVSRLAEALCDEQAENVVGSFRARRRVRRLARRPSRRRRGPRETKRTNSTNSTNSTNLGERSRRANANASGRRPGSGPGAWNASSARTERGTSTRRPAGTRDEIHRYLRFFYHRRYYFSYLKNSVSSSCYATAPREMAARVAGSPAGTP